MVRSSIIPKGFPFIAMLLEEEFTKYVFLDIGLLLKSIVWTRSNYSFGAPIPELWPLLARKLFTI